MGLLEQTTLSSPAVESRSVYGTDECSRQENGPLTKAGFEGHREHQAWIGEREAPLVRSCQP